ncbi:MAG: hypothetical protein LC792_07465 [Actinobacteria bacterium]|nr:hypothetical protein [Actinomycetota bacterium]
MILDEQGRFVAKADVGWSRTRLVLEYESAEFHPPRKWLADDARAKEEDLWPWSTRLRCVLEERFAAIEDAA